MYRLPNYKRATNAAYEVLQKQANISLPIDIEFVAKQYPNIRLKKYSEVARKFGLTMAEYLEIAPSEFGFVKKKGINAIILYNDTKGVETNRFTISHELGHCVLGPGKDNDVARKEADCFARNLLCPIVVIKELGIENNVSKYMETFYISEPMASTSIHFIDSDLYYITNTNYSVVSDMFFTYMTGYTLAELYGYNYAY